MLSIVAAIVLNTPCGQAYCRSHVDPPGNLGPCLYWPSPAITYAQSSLGNPDSGAAAFGAVDSAWATWRSAALSCSALTFTEQPQSQSRSIGYRTDGGNENLILFRQKYCGDVALPSDPCWQAGSCADVYDCWQHPATTIALTTTTYDSRTGSLQRADVELNASRFTFTTSSSPACPPGSPSQGCVATDIQATMTYEIGLLLGLDPVFSPSYGDVSGRTLDTGSFQFTCDVYPRGGGPLTCNEPDAGSGADAGSDAGSDGGRGPGHGCGCEGGAVGEIGAGLLAILALAVLHRRRSNERPLR